MTSTTVEAFVQADWLIQIVPFRITPGVIDGFEL